MHTCHTISHNFELLNIVFFNYLLIVVYRPPSIPINGTIELCDSISCVSYYTKTRIIYVDFNLYVIDWINGLGISSIGKKMVNLTLFTQKNGLLQLVNFVNVIQILWT